MKRLYVVCVAMLVAVCAAEILEETSFLPVEHPAIRFTMQRDTHDRIAKLDAQLTAGKARLVFDPKLGYVPALLKALDVNADSQVLVFSKTSIQNKYIGPGNPRAIYFNDDTMLGYVPGGELIELMALDPVLGVQPYTIEPDRVPKPGFARRDDCLRCHMGNQTMGIPGLMVSSVHPKTDGTREGHGNAFVTDQDTAFAERWGGWYVTGLHGAMKHLGNSTTLVNPLAPGPLMTEGTMNQMSVADRFNARELPVATSDIVALMTLEHQVRMTNILVRIGWDVRIREYDKESLDEMDWELDEAVRYMLFAGSPPLPSPVTGSSTFSASFPKRGPRDAQGRSLRDFDLKTRLFRYPLSYMIYSEAFDALPASARERLYQKLDAVLRGGGGEKYGHLTAEDRKAIREIVAASKKNVPAFWAAN
jgi:hypothetical protein